MARQEKFMVVHRDPSVSWEKIEENWAKAANVKSATWIRTYFNRKEGVRYCLWLAEDADNLEEIFKGLNVSWVSMLKVQETIPDLWGAKWDEHVEAESKADTLAF
jgi:hypothetical protein